MRYPVAPGTASHLTVSVSLLFRRGLSPPFWRSTLTLVGAAALFCACTLCACAPAPPTGEGEPRASGDGTRDTSVHALAPFALRARTPM